VGAPKDFSQQLFRRRVKTSQATSRSADVRRMAKWLIISILLALLAGCGGRKVRMERPEDPQGRYREQIAAAQALLEQKETWSHRAEWEVLKTKEGWEVIAWRVEHPDRNGPNRYLPWGYSVIKLDSRMVTVGYHRKG